MFNIPIDVRGLSEGLPMEEVLPNDAHQGLNDFHRIGYGGPCPPPGTAHRYYFTLYALDRELPLKPKTTKAQVVAAMKGHVLAEARLMGRFGR